MAIFGVCSCLRCYQRNLVVELSSPTRITRPRLLLSGNISNGIMLNCYHGALHDDFMFLGTEAISVGRVGDDFWYADPLGDPNGTFWLQGCHTVHYAYNSLWMGNFIHPDWDMFQSTHPCAEFHTAAWAICGGPIYVCDSVGNPTSKLLKSLVLWNGSILRCQYHALPTRDCLFEDHYMMVK
ncbi:Galactinol--sucrose galactosyltransferase [Morella rubra]|uniref:Galactinol--sucrose galactosyltransferase n=1 Tax=Morella rubra TaxID=262757 RepID=A0A6A1VUD0_9ROSI|nr:Galactinol--sucrose galactosyltransferase [Morella rubra]